LGELKTSVDYTHGQSMLEQLSRTLLKVDLLTTILQIAFPILVFLSVQNRDVLKTVAGVSAQFQAAVDSLYSTNQSLIEAFFVLHPTLTLQRGSYLAADNSLEQRYTVLLANFLPELKRRRKQQQAMQTISTSARVDVSFASGLLNDKNILHAAQDNIQPALNDLIAAETTGLAAQFFFRDSATGTINLSPRCRS
jgi:hypothetical protein